MADQNPSPPQRPKEIPLQIQVDDDTAQGIYANLAMVNHTETEFVIDFIFMQPGQTKGKVRARIISSPSHTRRLAAALADNVSKYEQRFGAIAQSPAPVPDGTVMH
jgi:hypothetical protein